MAAAIDALTAKTSKRRARLSLLTERRNEKNRLKTKATHCRLTTTIVSIEYDRGLIDESQIFKTADEE